MKEWPNSTWQWQVQWCLLHLNEITGDIVQRVGLIMLAKLIPRFIAKVLCNQNSKPSHLFNYAQSQVKSKSFIQRSIAKCT